MKILFRVKHLIWTDVKQLTSGLWAVGGLRAAARPRTRLGEMVRISDNLSFKVNDGSVSLFASVPF